MSKKTDRIEIKKGQYHPMKKTLKKWKSKKKKKMII